MTRRRTAALMVAAAVLVNVAFTGLDLANFAGYVLWSLWLIAFAAVLAFRRVPVGSVAR